LSKKNSLNLTIRRNKMISELKKLEGELHELIVRMNVAGVHALDTQRKLELEDEIYYLKYVEEEDDEKDY
jgi:hypothetical protein|tara:strand:- start:2652 stop:2861 length:210 start_codon:yes stop_codon:yes gene_type:complete